MSDGAPLPGGVNVMLGPVGNSPGPDTTERVTGTVLLMAAPVESKTVTINCVSSVPSTAARVALSAVNCSAAGVPATGQVGGGTLA